ncbi:hypothetical protein E2C01_077223 [Portunus trituberculatus]|uniref:Uncharacterized protein n=1 Tax=Portunus trituberculatus TaxID=210409 RepID=A0A5B7IDU0_PORTR|nr:hypothetical protein [Portunus trituberculatus]
MLSIALEGSSHAAVPTVVPSQSLRVAASRCSTSTFIMESCANYQVQGSVIPKESQPRPHNTKTSYRP